MRMGPVFAFFGTTASMIAVTNNVVAGGGIAVMVGLMWPQASVWACALLGVAVAVVLTWAFYRYQRWRFSEAEPTQAW
jgi:membrane protein YdbS with pleckstrin-like domain